MSSSPETPFSWIEAADLQALSYASSTWIPLSASVTDFKTGKSGKCGYRESYRCIETLVVPLSERDDFSELDWQSVVRSGGTDGVWADETGVHPVGHFRAESNAIYPVIQRSFGSGETDVWVLQQELEIGLQLLRVNDEWICPRENDLVVARLNRRANGSPHELLIRAEHLRDYLCARQSALFVCGFYLRDAVEEKFEGAPFAEGRTDSKFANGEREIVLTPIHEGGGPFGMETAVVRTWRESVNPREDVPVMPPVTEDPGVGIETYSVRDQGRKLHRLATRIWTKHWIEPASKSPRLRRDPVEARVPFIVENQEQKTLSGKALHDYRGWLWFKPSVIPRLLAGRKGVLRWHTQQTGEVGPAPDLTLHFGVNDRGLINVLGYKLADLPEWAQRIWVMDNVVPEGGLSQELHMSQNLAKPAATQSPEYSLWHNLTLLQSECQRVYGQALFLSLPEKTDFFRRIHRFHTESLESVCELCKELHRTVTEQIDLGGINAKIDPANAVEANKEKLRQIKRVALWLSTLGKDGRALTRYLAGVAELRQGNAHAPGSKLRESLALFDIPVDAEDYLRMAFLIIASVATSLAEIGRTVNPDASLARADTMISDHRPSPSDEATKSAPPATTDMSAKPAAIPAKAAKPAAAPKAP